MTKYEISRIEYNVALNKYYEAQEAIIKRKDLIEARIWPLINQLNTQPYKHKKDQLLDMLEVGKLAQEALTIWSFQEQLNDIKPAKPIK